LQYYETARRGVCYLTRVRRVLITGTQHALPSLIRFKAYSTRVQYLCSTVMYVLLVLATRVDYERFSKWVRTPGWVRTNPSGSMCGLKREITVQYLVIEFVLTYSFRPFLGLALSPIVKISAQLIGW